MVLWTIQSMAAWERLQQERILRGDGRRSQVYYRYAYQWMAEQMRLRLPPPHSKFPLWGWYRWQGIRRAKPDLRASGHLTKGAPGVRIEFELPGDRVLLSNFEAWHCVLNRCFLSLSEEEEEAFAAEMERASVQQKWSYPEPFRSRVLSSWQRIFDLEAGDPEWWGLLSERSIQATFWELSLSRARRVDKFTAR